MRKFLISLAALAWATTAPAADKLEFAPVPAWVKPVPIPVDDGKPDGASVHILVQDEQTRFEPGKKTFYSQYVLKIETPQGFDEGNINFVWNPDTDKPIVHRLAIHRGDKVINLLDKQKFTVVRRETNLENAMLDGALTATLEPEDLQVGDVLEFVMSTESSDPVLAGHVEQIGAGWNGTPVARAGLRAQWPATLSIRIHQMDGLPQIRETKSGSEREAVLAVDNLQPILPPNGAPARYQQLRIVEMSDFKSWADVAALMSPLYVKASTLPASGPLQDELGRIKAASSDPKARTNAALALVQDRIRYVFLGMNGGSLVPADAATTWERRFGDCKAKTAILLALLHGLGMEAVPVLVNAESGDGLDQRLPMLGLFDHVIVRATIGGRTYWLDGTRSGDTDVDALKIPDFGWGLPAIPQAAALVRIVPPPLDKPQLSTTIVVDASAGLTLPAPTRIEMVMRGDEAQMLKQMLAELTPQIRESKLRDMGRRKFNFVDAAKVDAVYDEASGEERLTLSGSAHLEWQGGLHQTDGTVLGWEADFHRDPGLSQDAPFAVAYPIFLANKETIILPPSFGIGRAKPPADIEQTTAGMTFHRRTVIAGNALTIETSTRSIAPEFPASQAVEAQAALRKLVGDTLSLRWPSSYRYSPAEAEAAMKAEPTTADGYANRAHILLEVHRYNDAIADLSKGLALEPKNALLLANRAIAYVWLNNGVKAEQDIAAALALDPQNAVALRARGLQAMHDRRMDDAIAAFTRSLESDPQSAFALGWRAILNRRQGHDDQALADATASLKLDPAWDQLDLIRVDILHNRGRIEELDTVMRDLLAHKPDDPFILVMAANYHALSGRMDDAMREYDHALHVRPSPFIYLNRADHRPQADVAGRKADVEAALKLNPSSSSDLLLASSLQHGFGDSAGAIATLDKVVTLTPGNPEALVKRGVEEMRAGRAAQAQKDFAAARMINASATELNEICWSKATAGVALPSALEDCDSALTKSPDDPIYLDSRALVLLRLGRVDEAIADYDRALAKSPAQAASLYGRGVAYARKGDKAHSDADLQSAIKIRAGVKDDFDSYGMKP